MRDCKIEPQKVGVMIDSNLNMRQQCALIARRANRILECIKQNIATLARKGIITLCSVLEGKAYKEQMRYFGLLHQGRIRQGVGKHSAPEHGVCGTATRAVGMGLSCWIHRAFGYLSQPQGLDGAEWSQEVSLITAMVSSNLEYSMIL